MRPFAGRSTYLVVIILGATAKDHLGLFNREGDIVRRKIFHVHDFRNGRVVVLPGRYYYLIPCFQRIILGAVVVGFAAAIKNSTLQ